MPRPRASSTASRTSGCMAQAMQLAARPRAIYSSTLPCSTTGAAATPPWDICRRPRFCKTGSKDGISKKWRHEDGRLEGEKRRAPQLALQFDIHPNQIAGIEALDRKPHTSEPRFMLPHGAMCLIRRAGLARHSVPRHLRGTMPLRWQGR